MTNEMVQFSDLNCFKELPTYMLQAKDMQILRSFKQEFEDFALFSDFAQVAPPGSGTLVVLFVYNYTITLVIKSNARGFITIRTYVNNTGQYLMYSGRHCS
jgi:hypothetical protein